MRRWTSNRHRSEHPVRKRGCVLILQEHYKRNRGIKERRYVPYFFQVYFPLFCFLLTLTLTLHLISFEPEVRENHPVRDHGGKKENQDERDKGKPFLNGGHGIFQAFRRSERH